MENAMAYNAHPFTAADKLKCVQRELKMRQQVYGRRCARGEMDPAWATREIALMEEIVADYKTQAEKERLL
jgi:hypothetical protein